MFNVDLSIREGDGLAVVALCGELDLADAPAVASHLITAVAVCGPSVIVDLTGLEGIDYSGLAVLLRVRKWTRRNAGDLSLAAPQPPVRRILEATGLIDVFSANPSMGQAASSARHAGHGHRRRRDGPVPPWLPDLAAGGRHAAARHSLDEPGMCRPGHIAREACVKRRSSRERLRPDRSQLIRWFSRQAGIVVAVTVA